jgi:type VI secretion system secreted protein VgrG
MTPLSQSNRPLALYSPLGDDAVVMVSINGTEVLSDLFRFDLDFLSPAPIAFDRVLNEWATVRIADAQSRPRFINGIIRGLRERGTSAVLGRQMIRYSAVLVPALWRLTLRMQSRIFQHLTVPDILRSVLVDGWRLPVNFHILGRFRARNYCVQYEESDFAFVSRLMEEEGISYAFVHETQDDHSKDRHILVVTDNPAMALEHSKEKTEGAIIAHFRAVRETTGASRSVWNWETIQDVRPAAYSTHDYSFEVANKTLGDRAAMQEDVALGSGRHRLRFSHRLDDTEMLEEVEAPGGFAHHFDEINRHGTTQDGDIDALFEEPRRRARMRASQAASAAVVIQGTGDIIEFSPGRKFALRDHFRGDGDYLLTRVEHRAEYDVKNEASSALPVYENHFECLPAELVFRPARRTPKPRIEGTQTAWVMAPKDEPAFLDKYGRVKVKFHWDRSSTTGADASCWLRVAQVWAGRQWGAFFWPRPGHEVVVSFENGDPDRPLVVGSVYNSENPPPLSPKDHPAANGFKSCTLGGDPLKHFNTLIFYDDKGDEHVHIHSETHEVVSSNHTKFTNTPGPAITFNGIMPPIPGSGGGGGLLEYPTVIKGALGGSGALSSAFYDVMPGSSSVTCGDAFAAILGGQRTTHVLGFGGDIKIVFDVESLFSQLGRFGDPGALKRIGLPIIGALFQGASGDTTLDLSSKKSSTFGDVLDFRLGETLEYRWERRKKPTAKSNDWFAMLDPAGGAAALAAATAAAGAGGPPVPEPGEDPGAWWVVTSVMTLGLLTVTVAMASDISARLLATFTPSASYAAPNTGASPNSAIQKSDAADAAPAWIAILSLDVSSRLHALLLAVEKLFATIQTIRLDDKAMQQVTLNWAVRNGWAVNGPAYKNGGGEYLKEALDWSKTRIKERFDTIKGLITDLLPED